MARYILRCLLSSASGFLLSIKAVWYIFVRCFINASARPLASGSSALTVVLCVMPAHLKYCCSVWFSLPLNGGPPSDFSLLQNPCLANISSSAGMLASADVLLTTATSGYLENSSITTRRCFPSGRGPQWSADSFSHGPDGRMEGWRNGGMEEWWNRGMEEWRNGGMEEWRIGGIEGWRNGEIEEWRNGGMEEWMNGGIEE